MECYHLVPASRDDVRLFAIFLDDYHVKPSLPPAELTHRLVDPLIAFVRALISGTQLESIVTHLGGLKEGRKSLILVSEGVAVPGGPSAVWSSSPIATTWRSTRWIREALRCSACTT